MRNAIFAFLFLLTLAPVFQQAHAVTVSPNIEIAGETFPDRQRVEPTIAIDPHNPSIVAAGAQDLRLKQFGEHRWHGFYRSIDGGSTWSSSLLPGFPGDTSVSGMASPLRSFNATSDPILAFDRLGNLYYAGIAFNTSNIFASTTAFVAKFSDDGSVYSGVTMITGVIADKPWIAVDTSGGANDGNIYLAFDGSFDGVVFTRSTDGGVTFSRPTSAPGIGTLAGLAVDPAGNIFLSSLGCNRFFTSCDVLVSRSTNGGLGFSDPTKAATKITPVFCCFPGNDFRAGTIPQIAADANGETVVWDQLDSSGIANVFSAHSTDRANTWSTPIRVNDIATGQHFFPTVAVSGGVISIAWYDSRLGQLANGTITGLDVFYASSIDGGSSFSANLRVTNVSFDPNKVLRTDTPRQFDAFIGDYIQIAASPTAAHPIWSDNRNACDTTDPTFGCVDQDIFTATITF